MKGDEEHGKTGSRWIDISVPIKQGMVRWLGDPAVRLERLSDRERGDAVTVSLFSGSVHTGTHIDAPMHYLGGAPGIDRMPFEATVGVARVIAIRDKESIKADELRRHRIRRGQRLLFKTINSSRCWKSNKFVKDFVHLSHEGAEYLVERNVRTVGIDYLSIGRFSGDGDVHILLLGAGIYIIEGLNLAHVKAGSYDLICLPLRLADTEGSPARAILRAR